MLRKAIKHARTRRAPAAKPAAPRATPAAEPAPLCAWPCAHCSKMLHESFPCNGCNGRVCSAAGDCNKLFGRQDKRGPFTGKPWVCSAYGDCKRRVFCAGMDEVGPPRPARMCHATEGCTEVFCGDCVKDGATCRMCGVFSCTDCASVPFLLNNTCDLCRGDLALKQVMKQALLDAANAGHEASPV